MRTSGVDLGRRAPGRECTVLPGVTAITVAQESTPVHAATGTARVQAAPQDNTQALPAPAIVQAAPLAKHQPGQDPVP